MLKKLTDKIASQPWAYDLIQFACGGTILESRARKFIASQLSSSTGHILDVGGGTARARALWPEKWMYTCLDNDVKKLDYTAQTGVQARVVGDATSLPFPDSSYDAIFMKCVLHHLDHEALPKVINEALRVLTPTGVLIVVDGVWRPHRIVSRVLWKYDRGSYPRTVEQIQAALRSDFILVAIDKLSIFHSYILLSGRPPTTLAPKPR